MSNLNNLKVDNLKLAQAKMKKAGVDPVAISVFSKQYQAILTGQKSIMDESDLEPVKDLISLDDIVIKDEDAKDAIQKIVIVKLNGGLGTSMGLEKAKSLIRVRGELTFLDIIARQILHARKVFNARLPLIFMDSLYTRDDTLEYLKNYPELAVKDLPLDFLQNSVTKLRADDFAPIDWPTNPSLEWSPPGHGDIYAVLLGSGLLKRLLDAGYEYMHISNSDNLGAVPSAELAGWFATSGAPFAIEACKRTVNDKKGGHLAIRKSDNQMVLRELAQTDKDDLDAFMDVNRHRYFNTNNIWLNIPKLYDTLSKNSGVLDLPFIQNHKTVDPTDPSTPQVIQLESAMGSAIEKLEGATAIEVPRSRFLPVKTTNELLLVMSDVFDLADDYSFCLKVSNIPAVNLDERYYRLIADFNKRFLIIPSLIGTTFLSINGDWVFDKPSKLVGDIKLKDNNHQTAYSL